MALPRLNEVPQYKLTLPSSDETINYRPFLVKEQKVLLIAYESQDESQIVNAIMTCISNCTDGVDVTKLSTFDTDYIFTKIRSKSVGEKVTVTGKCKSCAEENEITIDLEQIRLEGDRKAPRLKITDDIHVNMKYPTYAEFISNQKIVDGTASGTETLFSLLNNCIESIATNDELISIKDEPKEEVARFIESLTTEQFSELKDFADSIPKIVLDYEFTCEHCNTNNKNKLEGLKDFFS